MAQLGGAETSGQESRLPASRLTPSKKRQKLGISGYQNWAKKTGSLLPTLRLKIVRKLDAGEQVLLVDRKQRRYLVRLAAGAEFQIGRAHV